MHMAIPIRHPHSQIGIEERRRSERWRAAKVSVDKIAEKVGRHRSTIFRELRRNRFDDVEMPTFAGY
jgi:IS30 family transposase